MPTFPPISGMQMIKVLEKCGYEVIRTRGSHVRLKHPSKASVTVPLHKELGLGLALKILRDVGLTQEGFMKLI